MGRFWTEKIHKFYLNFVFCTSILVGFVLASLFKNLNFSGAVWLALGLILLIFSFWRARIWAVILIFSSGILLSFWRFSNFEIQKKPFERLSGQTVELRGIIAEDPDFNQEKNEFSLRINAGKINSKKVSGRIFGRIKTSKKLRRADEIILKGKLSAGFGSFSASMYRASVSKIIRHTDFVRDTRDWFSGGISQNISSPELELGLGYLLGQKNSLPTELERALRITALTHIVVASGYNLTVLVNFSRRKFGRVSKKLAGVLSVVLICGFVLLVGFSPSMTRAGIVAILGVIFWYFGRKPDAYFLLILVAAVTLILDPANLFDLGWLLSFGSFFGVMILSSLIQSFLFENPEELNALAKTFFETLSAQIATLPLIIFTFGAFSSVSIVANLLVLPFVPLAMLLTFLTGIFAQILSPIAQIFGFLAEMVLKYSIAVVEYLSIIQNAQVEVTFGVREILIFYAILAGLVIFLEFKNSKQEDVEN